MPQAAGSVSTKSILIVMNIVAKVLYVPKVSSDNNVNASTHDLNLLGLERYAVINAF